MFEYLKGIIVSIYNTYIVMDVNGIGYKIFLINNIKLQKNKETLLYIYHHVSENQNILFGFYTPDEKLIFANLIKIKNVGVKTAYMILNRYDINVLYDAVINDNTDFLLKIPKINKSNIEAFKKSIAKIKDVRIDVDILNSDIFILLKNLDYSTTEILKVYEKLDKSKSINIQLKEALKILEGGNKNGK